MKRSLLVVCALFSFAAQAEEAGGCYTRVRADIPVSEGLKMLYSHAAVEARENNKCESGQAYYFVAKALHLDPADTPQTCARRVRDQADGGFIVHHRERDAATGCPRFEPATGGTISTAKWVPAGEIPGLTPERTILKCVRKERVRQCLRYAEHVRRCVREEYRGLGCGGGACGGPEVARRCMNEEYVRYCLREKSVRVCTQEEEVLIPSRDTDNYVKMCGCVAPAGKVQKP